MVLRGEAEKVWIKVYAPHKLAALGVKTLLSSALRVEISSSGWGSERVV
jgi:hypothetical protein